MTLPLLITVTRARYGDNRSIRHLRHHCTIEAAPGPFSLAFSPTLALRRHHWSSVSAATLNGLKLAKWPSVIGHARQSNPQWD
jgi:hypothetical protein